MLFKGSIIAILTNYLPILYTSIYATDKKRLRKFFKDANHLSIKAISRDLTIQLFWIHVSI